jgi:hypothetical protein
MKFNVYTLYSRYGGSYCNVIGMLGGLHSPGVRDDDRNKTYPKLLSFVIIVSAMGTREGEMECVGKLQ